MAYLVVYLIVVAALKLVVAQNQYNFQIPAIIPFTVLTNYSDDGTRDSCPSQGELDTTIKNINQSIFSILQQLYSQVPQCGDGLWHQVAYLNVSDPSHLCPSPWREITSDGIRVCGQPSSGEGSCHSVFYPVNSQYSKVCGRVIGYQFGSPDAFINVVTAASRNLTIDEQYLDGISITHGKQMERTHIWSFAAGATENGTTCPKKNPQRHLNCPCSNSDDNPPSYVGNNYYCESANQRDCFTENIFFPNDPLWDGQQCDSEGTCCTGTNTPPWFSVDLHSPTSDDIEVRICHDQATDDEDTPIQQLELYIQ